MADMFNAQCLRESPEAQELNRKWLAALRSGEFEQAHGALRKVSDGGESGYCCLGVAEEVARGKEAWSPSRYGGDAWGIHLSDDRFEVSGLTPETQGKLCLVDADGSYTDSAGQADSLVRANDHHMLNFEEIAEIIEGEMNKALEGGTTT